MQVQEAPSKDVRKHAKLLFLRHSGAFKLLGEAN